MADQEYADGDPLAPLRGADVLAIQREPIATHFKFDMNGLGIIRTITQASHPFAAGDAIGFNGTVWVKSSATVGQTPCHGICVEDIDANNFTVRFLGAEVLTGHGFTLGQNWLDTTAGGVTATEPGPGVVIQRVLIALDTNTVLLTIGEPIK